MSEFNERYLPYSNERYIVTCDGIFKTRFGEVLPTEIVDGQKMIRLQWLDGDVYYNVSSILCVLKFNVQMPTIFWHLVEAIFKDGDCLNTNIHNLVAYRFRSGPIEVREHPGFYYIPYFTKYAISKNLELLNLEYKALNTWIITLPKNGNRKGGYFSARAMKDIGGGKHTMRHRVAALVFLRYESNPWELVINHKDGTPGNDNIENLEWVTKAVNNQHAYDNNLFPNKVVPILMKNLNDGTIQRFPTLVSCAKAIGKSEGFVTSRLTKQDVIYPDKLLFKQDDGSEWIEPDTVYTSSKVPRAIIVRNIFTDTYIVYENARKASEACGLTAELIYNRARSETVEAINGFNFRLITKTMKWPNHSQKHLQIYKEFPMNPSFGVLILDKHGDEVAFYTSLENASKALDIDGQTILAYCRSKSYKDGKYFKLYRLTDNLGPVIVKTMNV